MKMIQYLICDEPGSEIPPVEFIIFARTKARADVILHKLIDKDLTLAGWRPNCWTRHAKHGSAVDLHRIMSGDEEGLGIFDEESGWSLLPSDWEEPGD